MRILIVDDDFSNRSLLGKLLAEHGECILEENGKNALGTFVKALHDGAPFDLVMLDIVMPEINGQELLQIIRGVEQRWGVPIGKEAKAIMVTSVSDPKEATRAFFKGSATAYLVKPVDKPSLDDRLRALFAPAHAEEGGA